VYNYTRGDFAYFQFQPLGGAATTLCITGHSLDIDVKIYEIINTCSGGLMWRLVGRTDARGNINADLDLDALAYQAPSSVIAGTRGIAVFGLSTAPGHGIQIPGVVEKTHYEVAMEKQVNYGFSFLLDARMGQLVYN
jgi:hypothetical protein